MPPSILHLSTYDANGGAGRAAFALHRAMVEQGVDSQMWVGRKSTDDPRVNAPAATRFQATSLLDRQAWRLQRSDVSTWRSPAYFSAISARAINDSPADVVNLHWVTDGFLSIRQIGLITKPIVWSLVDMWPFSGTEHYGSTAQNERWLQGYTQGNRSTTDQGIDLDRRTWNRKKRDWQRPMTFAAASTWMADRIHESALLRNSTVVRIPHVLGAAFAPQESTDAPRQRLGLPLGIPLIAFLSSAGIHDARKGWDLLDAALVRVRSQFPTVEVVIAGPANPEFVPASGVPIRWLGSVDNDASLADLYSATDVTVVPSREDNMPLSAMEAQTCGRPVTAFAIGGLPDIVEHRATGYLARPFDTDDLASGIIECLGDAAGLQLWSQQAAARAQATWSPEIVVPRYLETYAGLLQQ